MDEQGHLVSSTQILCPVKKHLEADDSIRLQLSFNGVEFYTITDAIVFEDDERIFPAVP